MAKQLRWEDMLFSYGVVILEVACGRRPMDREPSNHKMVNSIDWAWELYCQGRIIEVDDDRLRGEFDVEEHINKTRESEIVRISCSFLHNDRK